MFLLVVIVVAIILYHFVKVSSKQDAQEQEAFERMRGEEILRARAEREAAEHPQTVVEPVMSQYRHQDFQNYAASLPTVTLTEVLLAWFLGYFGAHKFYRKKIWKGFLYFFTLGLFSFWWMCDAFLLTTQYLCEKQGITTTKILRIGARVAGILCALSLIIYGNTLSDAQTPADSVAKEIAVATESSAIETTITEIVAQEGTVPEDTKPTIIIKSEPNVTMGMRNALRSAENYLAFMAFSRSGLISQLEFEGYSNAEAKYAADNCGADWNEQAAKSARNYLSIMPFSKSGLIQQLEFEGFTHAQAVFGAESNGY